jgi:hypothetical protein
VIPDPAGDRTTPGTDTPNGSVPPTKPGAPALGASTTLTAVPTTVVGGGPLPPVPSTTAAPGPGGPRPTMPPTTATPPPDIRLFELRRVPATTPWSQSANPVLHWSVTFDPRATVTVNGPNGAVGRANAFVGDEPVCPVPAGALCDADPGTKYDYVITVRVNGRPVASRTVSLTVDAPPPTTTTTTTAPPPL